MKIPYVIIPLGPSILMFTSCTSLKKRFLTEATKQVQKHPVVSPGIITDQDIALLPQPVQRYFRYCGYVGKEKMINAQVWWDEVYLKMAPEKDWTKIACYQVNALPEPARFDYMKSHYLGIFPFEGSHMYHDQKGSMQIVLLKLFKVVNGKGKEFDESELVTILSEILFVPSYALQSYITWTAIDDSSAKATLRYGNSEVSGVFFFNEKGECTHFDTEDRYYNNHDGTYKKVKWSAVIENYQEQDGIIFARDIKAVWHTDKGDFEYFKGKITRIDFNITKPVMK